MKRLLVICTILALCSPVWGLNTKQAIIQGRTTALNTDCSTYIADGQLCYDTDDDVLYIGNGTAAVAAGSVAATSSTQTWGAGSGITWTFNAGATDPVLTFGSGYVTLTGATSLYINSAIPYFNATTSYFSRFAADAAGPNIYVNKSRGATTSAYDIVIANDDLGTIYWRGSNGTSFDTAATILGEVDGTPGASADMPGRLVFSTSADGSATPTERMRISSTGAITVAGLNAAQNYTPVLTSTAGVLSYATYSLPSADCTEGQLLKADGSGNFACSSTLGLYAFILPTGTSDPATTSGMILHDTDDTTFSNAGGTVKYLDSDGTKRVRVLIDSGATNYTPIVKTEFLPIAWAVDGATAPTAIADVTGKEIKARSFSEADDVVFWWIVPPDYVGGIKYRVFYALSANASADDTAVFSMAGSIVANSGDLDGSAGTALTISDELTTDDDQYQVMVTDYSAASNSDWSLAAGGLARLNFSHAAASDMVGAGEPLVIGIEIKYKAKLLLADQY